MFNETHATWTKRNSCLKNHSKTEKKPQTKNLSATTKGYEKKNFKYLFSVSIVRDKRKEDKKDLQCPECLEIYIPPKNVPRIIVKKYYF